MPALDFEEKRVSLDAYRPEMQFSLMYDFEDDVPVM